VSVVIGATPDYSQRPSTERGNPMVFNHKQTKFSVTSQDRSRCVVSVSLVVIFCAGSITACGFTANGDPAAVVGSSTVPAASSTRPEPSSTATTKLHDTTIPHGNETVVAAGLTAQQKLRTVQLISLFENSTRELQYGYIENLNDGRGYTAGRAGFTSATGDLVLVVRRYVGTAPASPLAAYLPELERLASARSSNVAGLDGFVTAWQQEAGTPAMHDVQDQIADELYYRPAMQRAARAGVKLPLSLAAIYDTTIQHGEGIDPDGMPSILAETMASAGRPADSVAAQSAWLRTFLTIRRAHLSNAHDPTTRAAWAASVGRVDTLVSMLDRNLTMLDGPFTVSVYGDTFTVP
jgi:chitosanase